MHPLIIDYNIPVWGIITTVLSIVIIIIYPLFATYFTVQNHKRTIVNHKNKFEDINDKLEDAKIHFDETIKVIENKNSSELSNLKKDIEDKLDRHKNATDNKLSELNNTMIATKTMVELLVGDRIKKPGQ